MRRGTVTGGCGYGWAEEGEEGEGGDEGRRIEMKAGRSHPLCLQTHLSDSLSRSARMVLFSSTLL